MNHNIVLTLSVALHKTMHKTVIIITAIQWTIIKFKIYQLRYLKQYLSHF